MEAVDNKYKRWGWGALIGLGVVILIAAIVVGVSSRNTPVKTVEGSEESTQAVANNPSNSGNTNNSGNKNKDEGRDNDADAQKEGNNTNNNGGTNNGNGSTNTNNGGANNTNNSGDNSNNTSKTNNTSNGANGSSNSNMPKTGPEDDMIAFIAWAVIAGLGAYYMLGLKK